MPTVKQQIDVHVPARSARAAWDRFLKWVLVGNYRFVCDEFSCERAVEAGVVTFTENEGGVTRVCITFDYEDQSPDRKSKEQMVNVRLLQDLARFKQFAETGTERTAAADLDAQARTARRRRAARSGALRQERRHAGRTRPAGRASSTSRGDHRRRFPHRRLKPTEQPSDTSSRRDTGRDAPREDVSPETTQGAAP